MPRATMKLFILGLSILAALAALTGCGTKTPLTKPAGPVTPTIFGAPPAAPPAAAQSNSPTAPQPAAAPRDDSNKPAAVAP